MKFRYHTLDTPYGAVHTPLIEIRLKNPKNDMRTPRYTCLVDSGAASCVFHAPIGELIGLDIRKGAEQPLRGVIAQADKQYVHDVVVIVEEMGKEIYTQAGFTYAFIDSQNISNSFPYGILGQRNFFESLKVKFNLKRRIFEVI